ncbi:hypothetical protein EDEG_00854 [Edhazardia aedis USNM 41457]|uniref:Uncharacterized protein n=1 Tax=Edhazardia aedis (strain USNM 41457) TaxID=1003232 RepID=J8ZZM1_EDHAE|nr:hypothetical protein EDEG_00854 [Edhazardia aedis USNM 41457]|eukprot:EJW05073.1 hypothetical protein EDEG_00854 [Edhazardia aedis USNM 41457]
MNSIEIYNRLAPVEDRRENNRYLIKFSKNVNFVRLICLFLVFFVVIGAVYILCRASSNENIPIMAPPLILRKENFSETMPLISPICTLQKETFSENSYYNGTEISETDRNNTMVGDY